MKLTIVIILALTFLPDAGGARVIATDGESRGVTVERYEGDDGWKFVQVIKTEQRRGSTIYREIVIQNKPGTPLYNQYEFIFATDPQIAARLHKARRGLFRIFRLTGGFENEPLILDGDTLVFRMTGLGRRIMKLESSMKSSGVKFPEATLWRRGQ